MSTTLKLATIRTDGGTQSRVNLNMFTIEDYAQAMRNGAQFPPIVVFKSEEKVYYLADGFHRHAAAVTAGFEEIECDVRDGDRRAAILYSVSANATHGQRRTREDVNRAIGMMLRDSVWGNLTNNAIAKHINCDPKTVAARRAELEKAGEIEPLEVRVAADGRMMDISKIGDGPQELPTKSMLDEKPSMHPSIPDDDELAVVEAAPSPMPAPKAIPSIVNFQPAPTRTESHPIPAAPAPKPVPTLTPSAPPPLPALTPVAPAPMLTLTPIPSAAATDPRQALLLAEATAALVQAMAVEAQRLAHEALATYERTTKNYIDVAVDKAKFEDAAKLAVHAPGIKNQAGFLLGAITIVEDD